MDEDIAEAVQLAKKKKVLKRQLRFIILDLDTVIIDDYLKFQTHRTIFYKRENQLLHFTLL